MDVTEVRITSPDWTAFKEHIDHYLLGGGSKFESSKNFAFLPDDLRTEHFDKVLFTSVDHVPTCIKYIRPSKVKSINVDPTFGTQKVVPINVNIQSLININYDHLHPVRYDLVKEAIAIGEIDMPYILIGGEGVPIVDNGRHRVVVMYKYGFKTIDILVNKNESDDITKQLSECIVRRPPEIESSNANVRKYELKDFIQNKE